MSKLCLTVYVFSVTVSTANRLIDADKKIKREKNLNTNQLTETTKYRTNKLPFVDTYDIRPEKKDDLFYSSHRDKQAK